MDGIYVVLLGYAQNVFDIKISVGRAFAFADHVGLVGFVAMQGQGVLLGIYSNSTDS